MHQDVQLIAKEPQQPLPSRPRGGQNHRANTPRGRLELQSGWPCARACPVGCHAPEHSREASRLGGTLPPPHLFNLDVNPFNSFKSQRLTCTFCRSTFRYMEDVPAESFAMIARREELKFKHQSAVADAIEAVTHDTETCQSGRALAGLPFGR